MKNKWILISILLLIMGMSATADEVKGKVTSYSKKAKTIQVLDMKSKKTVIVKFDDSTKLIDAKSFKQLKPPTKILVVFEPGKAATSIKRILVKVPPEMVITTPGVKKLFDEKSTFTIIDARPTSKYKIGHIPEAISIFANDLEKSIAKLPSDKSQLIVFYCGGVTCGLSPKSAKIAKKHGYTNVKVYTAGIPDWKKKDNFVVVEPGMLAKNLNKSRVVIDVRSGNDGPYIKSAVRYSTEELISMGIAFENKGIKKQGWQLPGLRDKKAPVIVYSDSTKSEESVEAYKELFYWGYKNVSILNGGMTQWTKKSFPTADKKPGTKIVYVKKLAKGALSDKAIDEFKASKNAIFVDVRAAEEVDGQTFPGALIIPLDGMEAQINELPKDKDLILYCSTGARAGIAYNLLKINGFSRISFIDDEYTAYLPKVKATKKK